MHISICDYPPHFIRHSVSKSEIIQVRCINNQSIQPFYECNDPECVILSFVSLKGTQIYVYFFSLAMFCASPQFPQYDCSPDLHNRSESSPVRDDEYPANQRRSFSSKSASPIRTHQNVDPQECHEKLHRHMIAYP